MDKNTVFFKNKLDQAHTEAELDAILKELPRTTLRQRVEELADKHGVALHAVAGLAAMADSTYYALLNKERKPKKEQILRIGFALGLNETEMNEILKLAGLKELYSRSAEDAIIIFGLNNGLAPSEIDRLLVEKNCKMTFPEFREQA